MGKCFLIYAFKEASARVASKINFLARFANFLAQAVVVTKPIDNYRLHLLDHLLCDVPVKSSALPISGSPLGPGSFSASSYKCLRDNRQ